MGITLGPERKTVGSDTARAIELAVLLGRLQHRSSHHALTAREQSHDWLSWGKYAFEFLVTRGPWGIPQAARGVAWNLEVVDAVLMKPHTGRHPCPQPGAGGTADRLAFGSRGVENKRASQMSLKTVEWENCMGARCLPRACM